MPRARTLSLWMMLIALADVTGASAQQSPNPSPYRVPPVYLPRMVRPPIDGARERLRPNTAGVAAPSFDGDHFVVNYLPDSAAQPTSDQQVAQRVRALARAIGWTRDTAELTSVRRTATPAADTARIRAESERGTAQTRERVAARVGRLSASTDQAIRDAVSAAMDPARSPRVVWVFEQRVGGVPIDNAGVTVTWIRGRGVASANGRVFNVVTIRNQQRLSAADARQAAQRHVARFEPVQPAAGDTAAVLVLVPVADAFRYAWRLDVTGASGPYRLWIDADGGQVLQLLPRFNFDSAKGLVFVPSPSGTTEEKTFEIDPADGSGNFLLKLAGVLDVNNDGADGAVTGDLTLASTDFNTSPLNGTAVDRNNLAGYNGRFQDINVYAWIYNNLQTAKALGAQAFGALTATVNMPSTCGGSDQACATGNSITFGIGTATTSTSTSTAALFNGALDATVITHEWGHVLSGNQFAVGGGSLVSSVNEGLSDFWASTLLNTDTFGAYWARNDATPNQTGFAPRQADATDVFPEHRVGNVEVHADGQMIHWALWRARQDLVSRSILGPLVINQHLMKSLTTSGTGAGAALDDNTVHSAFIDILQQLVTEIGLSATNHSILIGFANAGLMLSDRDAVIDINDPYLARTGAAPTFTVWTGRDFTFNAAGAAVAGTGFNAQFTVEVANDAAFTVNHVTSPTIAAAVTGLVPKGSWTLPAADWANLSTGDVIFYRATTTDAAGGNARTTADPGNGFLTGLPPASAAINASGQCECTCSAASAQTAGVPAPASRFPLATIIPLAVAAAWWAKSRAARS